jgi:hypothetical protein
VSIPKREDYPECSDQEFEDAKRVYAISIGISAQIPISTPRDEAMAALTAGVLEILERFEVPPRTFARAIVECSEDS